MKIIKLKNGKFGVRRFGWGYMRTEYLSTYKDWNGDISNAAGYPTIEQAEVAANEIKFPSKGLVVKNLSLWGRLTGWRG